MRIVTRAKQDRAGQAGEQAREQDSAGQRAGRSRTATRTEDHYWRIVPRPKQDRAGQGWTESRPESRTEQDSEQDGAGQPPESRTPIGEALAGPNGTEQDRAGQSRTESKTEQDREQALLQHLSSQTRILLSPRLGF